MNGTEGTAVLQEAISSTFYTVPECIDGVPSYAPEIDKEWEVPDEVINAIMEQLADGEPLQQALLTVLGTGADAIQYRDSLFCDPSDMWRIPVAESITGRCLDINPRFGTRSLNLAELADEVYAVDQSLTAMQYLRGRTHAEGVSGVYPMHGTVSSIPPAKNEFDTIVLDISNNRFIDKSIKKDIFSVMDYLSPSGTLFVIGSGLYLQSYSSDFDDKDIGFTHPIQQKLSQNSIQTGAQIEHFCQSLGYQDISKYALVPSVKNASYMFDMSDTTAGKRMINNEIMLDSPIEPFVKTLGKFLLEYKMLPYITPGYLLKCTKQTAPDKTQSSQTESTIFTRGSVRTVAVVTEADGTLKRLVKTPHRPAHSAYHELEYETTTAIENKDGQYTYPSGDLTDSPFGTVYTEDPIDGSPMTETITTDLDSFRRAVKKGFDWIIEFQNAHKTPVVQRSEEQVRTELSIPELDLYPPQTGPAMMCTVPSHGDLHPKNIFIDETEIVGIIDWEMSNMQGNPITDPAYFVMQVSAKVHGGLRDGITKAYIEETEYSEIVAKEVRRYCTQMGIQVADFVQYLPYVWVERLKKAQSIAATTWYSGKSVRRANNIQFVWDHSEQIADRMC